MTYATPQALRAALEARIRNEAGATGISADRLRRRVIFQRIVARLQRAEPGRWILKGGMALEVRLRDAARLTKDIDLGLRDEAGEPDDLRDRITDALGRDDDGDGFEFAVGAPSRMAEDDGGGVTWRVAVSVRLAGRPFGSIRVDVSPRSHELDSTDMLTLPNSLDFAGVETVQIEIVDVHRHAAEKLHAMLKDFGERENSRVRDLVDLMLLDDSGLVSVSRLSVAVTDVWAERDSTAPPVAFPELPTSWPERYEQLAAENGVEPRSFSAAAGRAAELWSELFPIKEA
ncbi:MAG: nucleotidyl transferase AbiEii/AbiGii toxin family protein [Gaiellaceae bacterium]